MKVPLTPEELEPVERPPAPPPPGPWETGVRYARFGGQRGGQARGGPLLRPRAMDTLRDESARLRAGRDRTLAAVRRSRDALRGTVEGLARARRGGN